MRLYSLAHNQAVTLPCHAPLSPVRLMSYGLLALAFLAAILTYVFTLIIGTDMTNPRVYIDALSRQHVYNRIYTELFADPELEDKLISLLGKLDIDPGTVQTVSSLTVATLRALLPPEMLENGIEQAVRELSYYLRGGRQRLSPRVDLTQVVFSESLQDRLILEMQNILTDLVLRTELFNQWVFHFKEAFLPLSHDVTDQDVQHLIEELELLTHSIASGRLNELPVSVDLVPLDQLTAEQKQAVVEALIAPISESIAPSVRIQIETAIASDHLFDAIVLVSGELLKPHIARLVKEVRQELGDDALDMIASYATVAEEPLEQVIRRFNTIRDLVVVIRSRISVIAAAVVVITFVGVVQVAAADISKKLRVAGGLCVLGGVMILGAWVGFVLWSHQRIEPSVEQLPVSASTLFSDVFSQAFENIHPIVVERVAFLLFAGLVLVSLSFLPSLPRMVPHVKYLFTRRLTLVVGSAMLLVGVLPIGYGAIWDQPNALRPDLNECNGHLQLCDRPFHEVVFAATHNAMSISEYGWIWPEQDGTITEQLETGIRALLIDTYYWHGAEQLEDYLDDLPKSNQEAIRQIIANLQPALYREGTYLCHNTCLLGGMPLVEALEEVRQFLDTHPREVVVLIIQDAITPEDTEQAFIESGLLQYVYTYNPDEGWLTLGEMIELDERVVVMVEEQGPPPAWYHHLWDYAEETPYLFLSPSDFTCAPNRGGTGHDLFLLNHWIDQDSPSRVDAARVNQYSVLMNRVQTCMEERGHIPNFIAVNFYDIGDLMVVVDELNQRETFGKYAGNQPPLPVAQNRAPLPLCHFMFTLGLSRSGRGEVCLAPTTSNL